MKIQLALMSIALASFCAQESTGATIVLNAIQQTWISPTGTNSYSTTPRGNDTTINVRTGSSSGTASTGSARMYGVLEFDLSSVPGLITNAFMQLYMDPGQSNQGTRSQTANFIPLQNPAYTGGPPGPSPGGDFDQNTLTYATYVSSGSWAATDFPANQFGTFTFTGPVTVSAYSQSAGPDPGDLNYINGVATSSLPHLGLLLNGNATTTGSSQTRHDWSNGNNATDGGVAHPPQLVVEYTEVPEPSVALLSAIAMAGAVVFRFGKRKIARSDFNRS
jgi:hypothetical protein